MLKVIGTIPDTELSIVSGFVAYDGFAIKVGKFSYPAERGTPALLASSFKTAEFLGIEPPFAILVGDNGSGRGSKSLYGYLCDNKGILQSKVLVFHYLFPDSDWHGKIMMAIHDLSSRPVMIADAGFMYAAKMAGQADCYDLFTPDVGELAFLADEEAPHPFYTRGFLLHEERRIPELIERAYQYKNAPKYLLVKASSDYIVEDGKIVETVSEPTVPAMEGIGGTGDTLTGIVSTLVAFGIKLPKAAIISAKVNRLAGYLENPTLKTPVRNIVNQIPQALEHLLDRHHCDLKGCI